MGLLVQNVSLLLLTAMDEKDGKLQAHTQHASFTEVLL